MGWGEVLPDAQHFLWSIVYINVGLLVFNLLPVYPLDGGQILRSLLWFALGRTRSLKVATMIGFAGAAGLLVGAFFLSSVWMGVLALFMLVICWRGWKQAAVLSQIDAMPRQSGFACPACEAAPPVGAFWMCHLCRTQFDTFATGAVCPKCQARFETTMCIQCGASRPLTEWVQPRTPSPG